MMRIFTLKLIEKVVVSLLFCGFVYNAEAQTSNYLRRPVSPESPMWLIHIDTWNYADPQKIIDLIPEDIKPFVVMNISLSISHNSETSQFQVAEYGYEIAKSWLRTCAENQMWAMVQLSSGGFAQFSDHDLSVYEAFYQEYPNLIGFNYAEQFWGFDDASDPLSAAWVDRMSHFANLLKLSNKYGGYLTVSWCGNQWSPSINPIAMMKRNPNFADACRDYTENYILMEKYTQQSYQSDMESLCLGAYLSGYSGNYGIRYDDTGWTDSNGNHDNFSMATASAPHLEHVMLTGQTIIDGPELIWTQCFRETNRVPTTNGYTSRNWDTFSQFDNISVDLFRKIIDGTVRIPSRSEVIDRTKVVVVNDVTSGTSDEIYSSPETLFEGLYRMDGDGNLKDNKSFFKKTGRYPTIPTVFDLDDSEAQSFQVQVNKSDYETRWATVESKQTEFNNLFPEEYTGDLYASRHENGWVVYNPFKTGQTASANIPFKYNTSSSMDLTLSQYSAGVIKETDNELKIYLNNYDNVLDTSLKTDVIKINGCSEEPTYSFQERGSHQASVLSKNWSGGVFTLTIQHNGPLDISINCEGNELNRLTAFTNATIIEPQKPVHYTGARQNEAECFDYKNISRVITGGQYDPIRNYQGQGYVEFGTSASASIRDNIVALRKGTYQLAVRYTAPNTTVSSIDLYVNGAKVSTPIFSKTANSSTWGIITQNVDLEQGDNEIRLEANASAAGNIYFDNIVFSQNENSGVYHFTDDIASLSASTPAADFVSVQSGSAGVVSITDTNSNTTNAFKTYSAGSVNGTGIADLDMFPSESADYSITWKEYYTTDGGKKGVLLRASGSHGSCAYAEGMKQGYLFIALNNSDGTVTLKPYVANSSGISPKPTYTSSFTVSTNQAIWYRATALGNQLVFECSVDGLTWEGASVTTFSDSSYQSGATELVWGLNSNNYDWVIDDISYSQSKLGVSKYSLNGFEYVENLGPSANQMFSISGNDLVDDVVLVASSGYELSFSENGIYSNELSVSPINGVVENKNIYVRMQSGLSVGEKTGTLSISSKNTNGNQLTLNGEIFPEPISEVYNFSNDMVTTYATTPPAINATIGDGNAASAGVVSFSDINTDTSNMLKPYGVGQRNATGVINLNAFPQEGTDYSVMWKQHIGSDNTPYKIGVLLRGNTNKVGTSSTGYVQGIMEGYLFIVYNTGTSSEFRMYRSTDNGLSNLITTYTAFDPSPNEPVWYRASISGESETTLTFEYSSNGVEWQTVATYKDGVTLNALGATQLVWGLAVTSTDFYIDDITYTGFEANSLGLGNIPDGGEKAQVIATQYYNLFGQRLKSIEYAQGIIIVVNKMSDGTVETKKIYKQN